MGHAFAIEPVDYRAFETTEDELAKCREWGLLSDKATKTKAFSYKRAGQTLACNIVGYVDSVTAVIAFENGQQHCIHPSYLKEMQALSFGSRGTSDSASGADAEAVAAPDESAGAADALAQEPASQAEPVKAIAPEPAVKVPAATKAPAKEGKKQKLQLPEEKVKMTATVQEFAKVPNHFTEEDDEVIIYDAVALLEPELEVGLAWSSHSATLKKLELEVGDKLVFDGKIAAKKLLKHPVPYKINNPSKIQKIKEE
ncbi:hypothetical protein [Cohnella yongneupensis]|uniref:Uncharacterized protein n=1 Tax=Cohnella yongneupensis TaxID=425006 RepID=A0ABW0R1A4_9BACL